MVKITEDYSPLSKSWAYSSNASTKSTTGYCGDSLGGPMEVDHVTMPVIEEINSDDGRVRSSCLWSESLWLQPLARGWRSARRRDYDGQKP